MYKIEKENLEALFRKIAESQDLILPIKKAGQTNFGLWNEGEEADLETLKTVKSGKDAFSHRAKHFTPVFVLERS